ncbi:MAG: OmpH family outer membrane protein [Bacteroidaceae bacterium]|nr:OmpH family outer membrane protein [Prevotellaceae bacterium]MDY2849358.1 OmpH family outer membrane protein [Bacteroidaceae bacterium]
MKFVASSVLSVILLSLMCSVSSSAQKLTFGYLSYDKILHGMADYVVAQERIKNIHEQYNKEAEYNEDKFFKMYAEYIQGQKTFPEEIMLKRQKELQVAMEQGISFRKDAEKLLRDTEAELLKPLKEKLNSAIAVVAKERKLAFVANTDANAYPYINPSDGIDITGLVEHVLEGKPLPHVESGNLSVPQAANVDSSIGIK